MDGSSGVRIPEGVGVFFFSSSKCSARLWSPPSFLFNGYRGKAFGGRGVYHSSPSSAKIKNKWNCTSASPVCLHVVVRDFLSHLSHARYMPRPPRNEVAMECEAPVIQISACCYLPSPHIQPPHHSGLQPPQSASPAHHGSFIVVTTMAKDSFKFHNQQVSLSCPPS